MAQHRDEVAGHRDVRLDRRDPDGEGAAKRRQRVLGREAARAAVAFEVEAVGRACREGERERDEEGDQCTTGASSPLLYRAAIFSSGTGLIFDACPAQPNCS